MPKTSKATDLKKFEHEVPAGQMIIRVEGSREFMKFAITRLSNKFTQTEGPDYTAQPNEIAQHYILGAADRTAFMIVWKRAKAEFPKAFPSPERIKKIRPDAKQIEEAEKALESAEASLERAISRMNQPDRSATYLNKSVSSLRGARRRAHRAVVMNIREAQELAAIFEDEACTKPRKLVYRAAAYRDHIGRKVKRQVCYDTAMMHWADVVKANSLVTSIGSVTPEYAERMVKQFGCLEAYLSYLRVGDTTAMRLPVIERALSQLRKIPRTKYTPEVMQAYDVATAAVKEFADWLNLVNAMYHNDILRLVENIITQKDGMTLLLDDVLLTLNRMRNRLIKEKKPDTSAPPIQRGTNSTPYVISICTPDEEEAA